MSEASWKKGERKTAALLKTRRQAGSGSQRDPARSRSDTQHPTLYIEEKYRAIHTARTLYDEVSLIAKAERRIPVVTLRSKGKRGVLIVVHSDHLAAFAREILSTLPPEDPTQ